MPATSQFTETLVATERARLMKIVADYLPATVTLGYIERGDGLTNEQIALTFGGDSIYEDPDFEEWDANNRWEGERYYIDDVQHSLGLSDWQMDLIRDDLSELLQERDDCDLFTELSRSTPVKWMRYWLDERDLDTDYLMDRVTIGVNGVGEVLDALGLLGGDQQTLELENQIADILANSGSDVAIYLLWCGDVDELIEAAAHGYEGGPTQTITWENPYLLLYNPFMGSGWADQITAKVTTTFDRSLLRLDERGGGGGYSFTDEVCGGWINDRSTTVTITRPT